MEFSVWIVAHLLGDFVFQTDHMASKKKRVGFDGKPGSLFVCATHVAAYTASHVALLMIFGVSGLPAVLAMAWVAITHFVIDWFGVAALLMGPKHSGFREHLKPWSTIVFDNTLHLTCNMLAYIALMHG